MSIAFRKFPRHSPTSYAEVRGSLETGDLLFCSGSKWTSRLIQRATDSVWSHVAFVVRLAFIDRVMVLESVESQGVRSIPLRRYLKDYSDGKRYPGGLVLARHKGFQETVNPDQVLKKFGQFAVSRFGYPYDRDEIGKIAARIARSFIPFSGSEKKKLDRDREYICSEYVWECYHSIGVDVDWDRRGFVAPADFARAPEVSLIAVLQDQNGKQAGN